MKILNIIRSTTDKNAELFIKKMAGDNDVKVIELSENINWEALVDDIFNSDKVTSWW